MGYKIEMGVRASEQLEKIDNSIRIQIAKFIDKLEKRDNPRSLGESLKENLAGYWKYRVGDYRIVAEIFDDKLIIYLIEIGHRSIIYNKVDKRFNK